MATNVLVKEAVLVTPAESTPTRLLTLSTLDSQLFLRFSIEYLLLYRPAGVSDRRATAARLKSALARALVPYYPLAGRVVTRKNCEYGKLQVSCRAQGAVFVEAVADHVIDEFDSAPKHVTQWRNLLSLHVADVLSGAPPLVIQLTWLNDGNATLGVGINHCVTDGLGSAQFLNHFADLAGCKKQPDYPKPVWDRHLLDPKPYSGHSNFSTPHPEFTHLRDVSNIVTRFENERLVPTSNTFCKKSLSELKTLALRTSRPGESGFTSFEVLTAHVWKSWAVGLNFPANQTLKLLFSVNVRDRVRPSLPAGFYGNAFVLGCATATAEEVAAGGLGHVAGLVRSAKQRVDDEHVRSVVEAVSESGASPDSVGVMIVSQWSRLGLERVDFGMGRPVGVGPICSDRYCLLLPVCDQPDAVRVMVAVPTSAVDKYEDLVRCTHS